MHKPHLFIGFFLFLSILTLCTSSNLLTLPLTSAKGLNFYGTGTFGGSVANAGDINGDGIDDIIIGSPNESSTSGIVYVIYGSKKGLTDLTSSNLATLSSDGRGFQIKGLTNSQLGISVSSAGDVNGDGIEDIIMGAPFYTTDYGYVYVMFGKKTGLRDLDLSIDSGSSALGFGITGPSGSYFGFSVNGTGDINGDSIDDIIIGAYLFNSNIGAAYVIYGKKTGLISMTITASTDLVSPNTGFIINGGTSGGLGVSVSGAGDVNGDGVNDIVVGAYNYNSGNGYAAVLFGSKSQLLDLTVIPGTSLSGRGYIITCSASSYLGRIVSGAGDINDDGLADVIVAANIAGFTSPTITYGGAVFVIYGSTTLSSEIDLGSSLTISPSIGFRITAGVAYSFLGHSSSNIGDLNGDGVDDIILAASLDPVNNPDGSVYIIYGNKAGLADIDGITPTNFVDSNKGFVISPIYTVYGLGGGGDFNGDNGPDLLIGAQNNSTTQGGTYVIFGTPRLSKSEQDALDSMMQIHSAASKATDAAALVISIINFSNPLAAILKSISDFISFIKYLNITYAPKLQYFLDNYQAGDLISIDNLSSAPQALVDEMNSYPLPAKFEKYEDSDGFYSSFLINFWPSLIVLLIILTFVPITALFKSFIASSGDGKIRKFIRWICTQLSQSVKWNLMISKFTDNYGSICLFTSIEFRTTRLSSVLEVFSFCICVFVTFGLLFAQIRMVLVVHKLQMAKITAQQTNNIKILEDTKEHLKDYQIVFESFKDGSFFQQSFLFIYNLRIYIFYAVISWLNFPLIQTLVNTSIEVIIFIYLIISRPLKSKMELVQYIVIELIFLVVNICTLGLAVLDFYESDTEQSRIGLGDAILFCNNALMYCTLSILFLSLLLIVIDIIKMIKQKWFKMKKTPKIQHRSTMNSHLSENVNDSSTIDLNPNSNSQFMNADYNNRSSPMQRPRKTQILSQDSTLQYQSNNLLDNKFDHQRSEREFHKAEEAYETSTPKS